eukprot:1141214-Pelagomonas_calceolata.AAC.2
MEPIYSWSAIRHITLIQCKHTLEGRAKAKARQAELKAVITLPTSTKEKRILRAEAQRIVFTKRRKKIQWGSGRLLAAPCTLFASAATRRKR